MSKQQVLPIYFCVEIHDFNREDFENHCRHLHISYQYLIENNQSLICLSKIETEKQLQIMLLFLIGVALTMNSLLLWSVHRQPLDFQELHLSSQSVQLHNLFLDHQLFMFQVRRKHPSTCRAWVSDDIYQGH